jgi:acetyl esterase/lipase
MASPLYGVLGGLPPLRVHVGEVLLDDSLRHVERAVAAGVDAKVDVWEGMPHGFRRQRRSPGRSVSGFGRDWRLSLQPVRRSQRLNALPAEKIRS